MRPDWQMWSYWQASQLIVRSIDWQNSCLRTVLTYNRPVGGSRSESYDHGIELSGRCSEIWVVYHILILTRFLAHWSEIFNEEPLINIFYYVVTLRSLLERRNRLNATEMWNGGGRRRWPLGSSIIQASSFVAFVQRLYILLILYIHLKSILDEQNTGKIAIKPTKLAWSCCGVLPDASAFASNVARKFSSSVIYYYVYVHSKSRIKGPLMCAREMETFWHGLLLETEEEEHIMPIVHTVLTTRTSHVPHPVQFIE